MKRIPFGLLAIFCAVALGLVAVRDQLFLRDSAASARAVVASAQPTKIAPDPAMRGRTAYLQKEDDGHYWANARTDGAMIRLMVDSGAAVVALTGRDAQKLHIDISHLNYNRQMITAGGRMRAASVTLDEIVIDRVRVSNVEAVVMTEGLETSLLGMSFLNRLTSWQTTPRAMLIRQ